MAVAGPAVTSPMALASGITPVGGEHEWSVEQRVGARSRVVMMSSRPTAARCDAATLPECEPSADDVRRSRSGEHARLAGTVSRSLGRRGTQKMVTPLRTARSMSSRVASSWLASGRPRSRVSLAMRSQFGMGVFGLAGLEALDVGIDVDGDSIRVGSVRAGRGAVVGEIAITDAHRGVWSITRHESYEWIVDQFLEQSRRAGGRRLRSDSGACDRCGSPPFVLCAGDCIERLTEDVRTEPVATEITDTQGVEHGRDAAGGEHRIVAGHCGGRPATPTEGGGGGAIPIASVWISMSPGIT